MKKLMVLMVSVLFTAGAMAQTEQTTTKQTTTTTEKSTTKAHECYMMKEGALIHCMGDKSEAQKTNVTLRNGTKITTTGEVITSDGKTMAVANGQCIDMKGMVGDCDKMHASIKHEHKNMQGEHKDY